MSKDVHEMPRLPLPMVSAVPEASASGELAESGAVDAIDSVGHGSSAPLPVIRGAKCQVEGTIDWFRASAVDCKVQDMVMRILGDFFGAYRDGRGRHSYTSGFKFSPGAEVWYTPGYGMCVDLPGNALATLAWTDKVKLLKLLLTVGLRCSRIDVALDYRGDDVTLIDDARRSAEAGELCRCRVWSPQEIFSEGERIAYGINFGRRGKAGSGRYIRIYDKGLQTGDSPVGQWVRWEAEFSKGHADYAALTMFCGESDLAEQAALLLRPMALGCVDFRENTGNAHLDRRPRVRWFADLLNDQGPIRVSPPRQISTLDSYMGWIRDAVYPTLAACAAEADCSIPDVVDDFTVNLRPKHLSCENPVACEYAQFLANWAGLSKDAG